MNEVAVVIPCYDLGATIGAAVDSVLAQTRSAADIVVVDDGSPDPATRDALRSLDSRARVLYTEHRGAAAARNHGANSTTTPYLLFLDGDDLLDPTYLEKAGRCLDEDVELDIVSSEMKAFGEASYVWSPPDCTLASALSGVTIPITALFRRKVWDEVGGFDERLPAAMDLDFWISAFERGFHATVLKEPLLYWRVRSNSLHHSAVSKGRHVGIMRTILAKHRDAIERLGVSVLDAKAELIATQRRHQRHLESRRSALREELGVLVRRISELHEESP